MGGVLHFEIHCDDVERAKDFYSKVLGWTYSTWRDPAYHLVDGEGIGAGRPTGALRQRDPDASAAPSGHAPNSAVVVFAVDDIGKAHATALANGGREKTPVTEIPDLGRTSYCFDTEDNVFGMITLF